jgi:hypothetical protein
MGVIKLLAAPIRSIVRFPLFQLAVVVAVILLLQAADDKSAFGQIFNGLDKLVDYTVRSLSAVFNVKSFTKSWLTSGFMIAYVYLACLLILSLMRVTIRAAIDFVGRSNGFWLRNAIARERGRCRNIRREGAGQKLLRILFSVAHQRQRETPDGHAFKSNRREKCVPMSGKMARSALSTTVPASRGAGNRRHLASVLWPEQGRAVPSRDRAPRCHHVTPNSRRPSPPILQNLISGTHSGLMSSTFKLLRRFGVVITRHRPVQTEKHHVRDATRIG